MNDFVETFIVPLAFFSTLMLICLALALGISYANEEWNCAQPIGRPTKVMAATCYVQNENGKWVVFSAYVRTVNIEMQP